MFEQKRAYWRNLDNAGKMFSAASTSKDTRVFRFYCVLKEQIDKDILQEALNKTIKKYPIFLSVMRKGLFWHYLEKSELRPVVREEYKEPCSCLYIRDKKALLFEITYYKNRNQLLGSTAKTTVTDSFCIIIHCNTIFQENALSKSGT